MGRIGAPKKASKGLREMWISLLITPLRFTASYQGFFFVSWAYFASSGLLGGSDGLDGGWIEGPVAKTAVDPVYGA